MFKWNLNVSLIFGRQKSCMTHSSCKYVFNEIWLKISINFRSIKIFLAKNELTWRKKFAEGGICPKESDIILHWDRPFTTDKTFDLNILDLLLIDKS